MLQSITCVAAVSFPPHTSCILSILNLYKISHRRRASLKRNAGFELTDLSEPRGRRLFGPWKKKWYIVSFSKLIYTRVYELPCIGIDALHVVIICTLLLVLKRYSFEKYTDQLCASVFRTDRQ